MMDCKKALAECGADLGEAAEWLRKKGLAGADKKAGRLAAEGVVAAYIHPGSRLGVLLEVNCETDFVAASDDFTRLVNGLAMQIAASPSVEYVTAAEVPAADLEAELRVEMGREDLAGKPEAIRAKIAEGRVKKLAQERVLLEQPWLMDGGKTVGEAVKEAVATVGENIQVRRFTRFVLGEGLAKKESNLAAEVAAATGGKA
jgi:elongation factor Ts